MRLVDIDDVMDILIEQGYIRTKDIQPKTKPNHGPCCCCQGCGEYHDDCFCDDNGLLEALAEIKTEYPCTEECSAEVKKGVYINGVRSDILFDVKYE